MQAVVDIPSAFVAVVHSPSEAVTDIPCFAVASSALEAVANIPLACSAVVNFPSGVVACRADSPSVA